MVDIEIYVDGEKKACGYNKKGVILVDIVSISKALGASLEWTTNKDQVVFNKGNNTITFKKGKKTALVNTIEHDLRIKPIEHEGSLLIPLDFLIEQIGLESKFYKELGIAAVNTNLDKVIVNLYVVRKAQTVHLNLEEYVAGVVGAQALDIQNEAALKALAVAARTYVVRKMHIQGGEGCIRHSKADVCDDENHCQAWLSKAELQQKYKGGFEPVWEKINKAVYETEGLIMTYNGKPIESVSHPACGGYTENSEEVWGNKVSYLRKVKCPCCQRDDEFKIEKTYNLQELETRFGVSFYEAGEFTINPIPGIFSDIEKTPGGRVKKITVGSRVLDGEEFKQRLSFPSSKIEWKVNSITFSIKGAGHGLGICRYGADKMAGEGIEYPQILLLYYTGIDILPMVKSTPNTPLFGKTIVIDAGYGNSLYKNTGVSQENRISLKICTKLKALLENEGAKPKLARCDLTYIPLSERVAAANDAKAQLFISVNQFSDQEKPWVETFYFTGDTWGKKIARKLHDSVLKKLQAYDKGIKDANFYVLRETDMPSVLLEIGITDHKKNLDEYSQEVAEAVVEGIKNYYL